MKTIQKIKVFFVFFVVLGSLMYCKKKSKGSQDNVEELGSVSKNPLFIYEVRIPEILTDAILDNVAGTIMVSEGENEIGLSLDPLENFVLGAADSKMKIANADADEDFLSNAKEISYIVTNPSDLTITKTYTLTVDASQAILAKNFTVDGVEAKDIYIDDENGKIQVITNKKRKDFVLNEKNLTPKNNLSDVNYNAETFTYTISRRGQDKQYVFEAISKDLEVIGFQIDNTIGKVEGQKIFITEGENGEVLNIINQNFYSYLKFENVVTGRTITDIKYFQNESHEFLGTDQTSLASHIGFTISMPDGEGGTYSRSYAVIIDVAPEALGLNEKNPFKVKAGKVLTSQVTDTEVYIISDDIELAEIVMNPINKNTLTTINKVITLDLRGTKRIYGYQYELYNAPKHAAVNLKVSSKILALNNIVVGQNTELPLIYGGHQTNVVRLVKNESLELTDFEASFEGAKLLSLVQDRSTGIYTLTVDFFGKTEAYKIIPQYNPIAPLAFVLNQNSDAKMVFIDTTAKAIVLRGEAENYTEQMIIDLFFDHNHKITVDLENNKIKITDRLDSNNVLEYDIIYVNPTFKIESDNVIYHQEKGNIVVTENGQLTNNDIKVVEGFSAIIVKNAEIYTVSIKYNNTTIESESVFYTVRELQAEDMALNFIGDKDQVLVINRFETTNDKAILKVGENEVIIKNPKIALNANDFVQASTHANYNFENNIATVTFGTKTVIYNINVTVMADLLMLELDPITGIRFAKIDEISRTVTIYGDRATLTSAEIKSWLKDTKADPYHYIVSKRTNVTDTNPDYIRVVYKNGGDDVLDSQQPDNYQKRYIIIYQDPNLIP